MYVVFPHLKLRLNLFALPAAFLTLYLEGVLPTLLLLASALFHEGGHLLAMKAFSVPVRRVDLNPMGAVILYDDSLCSLSASGWIAFAGAGANLTALLLCLPWASGSPYLLFFAMANGFLAFLNLLPWKALDGGKLLFCMASRRLPTETAEELCNAFSRLTAVFLAALLLAMGSLSAFPLWHLILSAVLLATGFC
jgi:membrane-associated protease RseP (regulator of RpoE activity)